MSLIINHNISAFNTLRNLEKSNGMLSKSLEKLSSGYKINVAADDPSGLIISEQLRSQVSGLERSVRNSQEASNVIGITEGALIEMNSILMKMRELAIHASNNGITAPEQVLADQQEVDSGIQTIDRIANTTRYSDQFLLNGAKSIIYDTELVDGRELLDTNLTRLDQVFKRDDLKIGVSYSGQSTTAGRAKISTQAERAMYEADGGTSGDEIDLATNTLSADQSFIITGNSGARQFSFSEGTDVAQMVSTINNVKDSTGVEAALVISSSGTQPVVGPGVGANLANVDIYGMRTNDNTDAQGQVWTEVVAVGPEFQINVYSDSAGTNLVAQGVTNGGAGQTVYLEDVNNSGIAGSVTVNGAYALNAGVGTETSISPRALDDTTINEDGDTGTLLNNWQINGIEIGENTDENGRIFVDVDGNPGGPSTISIYKDVDKTELVAQGTVAAAGTVTLAEQNGSGLAGWVDISDVTVDFSDITVRPQMGVRMFSTEYGSDKFIRLQATEGAMWEYYDRTDMRYERVVATDIPVTTQQFGQDALVTINGTDLLVAGLDADVSTPVFSGRISLQEGELSQTTMAQVGYERGNASSQIGHMYLDHNLAVNAGENHSEDVVNLRNGMQFQLTENEGDQARTVYGIPPMSVPNLGRIELDGETYTLQDVLGGGVASLFTDPVKSLRVVSQAIDDVSTLRARLGAFQRNMLQTNINSLNVAVENITKTESAIRDANMAAESTEFTKNQILVQAGTAMLAQANVVSQNILQLLG